LYRIGGDDEFVSVLENIDSIEDLEKTLQKILLATMPVIRTPFGKLELI